MAVLSAYRDRIGEWSHSRRKRAEAQSNVGGLTTALQTREMAEGRNYDT